MWRSPLPSRPLTRLRYINRGTHGDTRSQHGWRRCRHPIGGVLGRALGAFAGNSIDQHLFGSDTHREGPRLQNLEVQASSEGATVPLTFGRTRLSGQIIWATNYEEVVTTTRHKTGGKGGGPKHTSSSYSYFANIAVGLCEGPIAGIARVWADGKIVDLNTVTMRVHKGDAGQMPDPLISAKEGTAPAFQGTAYVVFERLPLEPYGNRLPQLSFEVLRPSNGLESRVRAVTVIPGATEFGYHPEPVVRITGPGATQPENTHDPAAPTDWHASINELQALCPNLERVALVVSWFGTSLDAAQCIIEPRVESSSKVTSVPWTVAGLTRASANPVSQHEGVPAFGSSPSDASIVAAIQDLKARGLKVTLLPFLMMDVPTGNSLPDPWTGGPSQPAYPWRGRITVSPAPGQAGTIDATAAARAAIAAFVGTSTPGPAEWSFRRFILHMADLAVQAGGVDAFLLCSELRGLTRVRDDQGAYPFVDALVDLAADVRTRLGAGTILTYGADWSEYTNHQPADGSGDVIFHLDPLWASPNIDVIGIDQYQPITDWRYTQGHRDETLGDGPHDRSVILAGLTGGENFDWYYASETDRVTQTRTTISDGAYGEPWVYRTNDLIGWWSQPHHNRVAGVRQSTPTAFVPASKPFWLTEFGAPAVDLAGNEPAAFPSDKPDNDRLPPASRGIRDDAQQRALLDTALELWEQTGSAANPLSQVDNRPMLDPSGIHLWTWDARPYPIFPDAESIWTDGQNWTRGHWLNGRLGAVALSDLILALCTHFDLPPMDVTAVRGTVSGFALKHPTTPRKAFADLSAIYALDFVPTATSAKVRMRGSRPVATCTSDDLVDPTDGPVIVGTRSDIQDRSRQVTLGFSSPSHDHQTGIVRSTADVSKLGPDHFTSTAVSLRPGEAGRIAERIRQEELCQSNAMRFAVPPSMRALEPGDTLAVALGPSGPTLQLSIDRVIDGSQRMIEAHQLDPLLYEAAPIDVERSNIALRPAFGPPDVIIVDLPSNDAASGAVHNVRVAAFADPWPGALSVSVGDPSEGFSFIRSIDAPSVLGALQESLAAGPVAYPQRSGTVMVSAPTGSLASISNSAFLAGGNLAAIVDGEALELLQFQTATLVGDNQYQLSGLLRGLGGTEAQALIGMPVGARFVLLDETVTSLDAPMLPLLSGTTVRVEPLGGGMGAFSRTDRSVQAHPRSLEPFAPVHLRWRKQADGALSFDWIRRTRGMSDLWELATLPLNEERERYRLTVSVSGQMVREVDLSEPSWLYSLASQQADGSPQTMTVTLRQLGTGDRPGQSRSLTLAL